MNTEKSQELKSRDDYLFDELEITGQGRKLVAVRKFIDKMAEESGFNETDKFDIKVAVGEACANAIEHGSPRGKRDKVRVSFIFENDYAIIEVIDEGIFKPRFPSFDSQLNYRGRGIPFMLALMDEVEIKERKGGTTVRLVKKRN